MTETGTESDEVGSGATLAGGVLALSTTSTPVGENV
jgi:hypothetical protein